MSDPNPYKAPDEKPHQIPGLVPPQVRTMSIASICAVFGTGLVVAIANELARLAGVNAMDKGVLSTLSVIVGALIGIVLGVIALRRSWAYPRSVVRTQSIAGIVINVLFLVWVAYRIARGMAF